MVESQVISTIADQMEGQCDIKRPTFLPIMP